MNSEFSWRGDLGGEGRGSMVSMNGGEGGDGGEVGGV
jgi:hypothetical protein